MEWTLQAAIQHAEEETFKNYKKDRSYKFDPTNILNLKIGENATKWTCNILKLPETTGSTRYRPENHTEEFKKKYNEIFGEIFHHLINKFYSINEDDDMNDKFHTMRWMSNSTTHTNFFAIDIYNNRQKIKTLEIENKLMSDKIVKLEEYLSEISSTFKKYDERFAYHEKQINFLTVRNRFLEDTCVIYKSPHVIIIQRYWRKYKLLKRIKEASDIYRLTKNFTNFVNPINIFYRGSQQQKIKYI